MSHTSSTIPTFDYFHLGNHPISYAVQMVANRVGVKLIHNDYIDQSLVYEKRALHILVQATKVSYLCIEDNRRIQGDETIMIYLINRFLPLEQHLYPRDPTIRASVDRIMWDLVNTICPLFSDMQSMAMACRHQEEAREELQEEFLDDIRFLEDHLIQHSEGKLFMYGDHLTIADLTASAIFTARYPVDLQLDELPRLNSYLSRLELAIPGYEAIQATVDESFQRALEIHMQTFPNSGHGPSYLAAAQPPA